MFALIAHFLSLIRFSHTLFALPFALLSATMAWRWQALDRALNGLDGPRLWVRWQELAGILLAMVAARSVAMTVNRLADRRIDAQNPRTANRHLPQGIVSVRQATYFALACSLAFVGSTLLFLPNRAPLALSIPVLLFLCGYSYAKRFTSLTHFWLGTALGMSPVAAWIAIRGEAALAQPSDLATPLALGGAVLCWVAGFDIIYACQDFQFDRHAQLHSAPVRLGVAGALRLAAGCHAATVALLAVLPMVYPQLGWAYWFGLAGVAALLVYEHALVRPDDLQRVNQAFFHVNAVISVGLWALGSMDAVW